MFATPVPVAADFFARLRVQDAAFSAGLPATLACLAALHDPARPIPTPAASNELQRQLHTLAGCAATFGYRRLGQEARALEQRLRVLQAFDNVPPVDWTDWFTQLFGLIAWASADPCRCSLPGAGAAALQLP
ncbi:MAG: Hpt domain-containing protein [Pseudomonadota bacterium]|nr:Hpt domain-containing protein [Pseudomonadota bacterium]